MSCGPIDSRTPSGGRLPATARSHGLRYAERGHAASSGRDLKAFAYYRARAEGLLSEGTVGLEDQAHGFVEVGSGFLEGRPLGVSARKLFHEGDVASGTFSNTAVSCRVTGLNLTKMPGRCLTARA